MGQVNSANTPGIGAAAPKTNNKPLTNELAQRQLIHFDPNEAVDQDQLQAVADAVGYKGDLSDLAALQQAVKQWQASKHLKADGIVGDQTWAAIDLKRFDIPPGHRYLAQSADPAPAPRRPPDSFSPGAPAPKGQPQLRPGAAAPADPNAADPNAADPNAADPNAADPNAADPNAADPNAADPNAADPNAADPNAADPNAAAAPPPPPAPAKGAPAPATPPALTDAQKQAVARGRTEVTAQAAAAKADADVAKMSTTEKIGAILDRVMAKVGPDVKEKLMALKSPAALTALAVMVTAWAAGHFFGVGEIADGLMAAVGYIALGNDAWTAAKEFAAAIGPGMHAKSTADLDECAEHLAKGISTISVDLLLAAATHGVGKGVGKVKGFVIKPKGAMPELPGGGAAAEEGAAGAAPKGAAKAKIGPADSGAAKAPAKGAPAPAAAAAGDVPEAVLAKVAKEFPGAEIKQIKLTKSGTDAWQVMTKNGPKYYAADGKAIIPPKAGTFTEVERPAAPARQSPLQRGRQAVADLKQRVMPKAVADVPPEPVSAKVAKQYPGAEVKHIKLKNGTDAWQVSTKGGPKYLAADGKAIIAPKAGTFTEVAPPKPRSLYDNVRERFTPNKPAATPRIPSDTPEAVVAKVAKEYPGAQVTRIKLTKSGTDAWEVMTPKGPKYLGADGKAILAPKAGTFTEVAPPKEPGFVERNLRDLVERGRKAVGRRPVPAEVPEPVAAKVAKEYPGASVKQIKLTKSGADAWEVMTPKGPKYLAADGKAIIAPKAGTFTEVEPQTVGLGKRILQGSQERFMNLARRVINLPKNGSMRVWNRLLTRPDPAAAKSLMGRVMRSMPTWRKAGLLSRAAGVNVLPKPGDATVDPKVAADNKLWALTASALGDMMDKGDAAPLSDDALKALGQLQQQGKAEGFSVEFTNPDGSTEPVKMFVAQYNGQFFVGPADDQGNLGDLYPVSDNEAFEKAFAPVAKEMEAAIPDVQPDPNAAAAPDPNAAAAPDPNAAAAPDPNAAAAPDPNAAAAPDPNAAAAPDPNAAAAPDPNAAAAPDPNAAAQPHTMTEQEAIDALTVKQQ